MADTEELSYILNQMRNSMEFSISQVVGEFRQAAMQSNANISRVVKDIYTVFKSQRQDVVDLENSINDVASETQEMSSKIDRLGVYMQDLISVETNILGSIRDMGKNIVILNDSTESLNENMKESLGEKGLLGAITSGVGTLSSGLWELTKMGIGAGAVVGGASMLGGDSNTSSFNWGSGPENVNMKAAADAIKSIESKGSGGYKAQNPGSSASGAYQFIDSTWQSAAAGAGIGTQFKRAVDAPPEIQDAVFNDYFQKLIKKEGLRNAVLTHFLGPKHTISAEAQRNNITPSSYLSKFERSYSAGSSTNPSESASATTPRSDATPAAVTPSGKDSERMEGASPLPSGDLVALGKALQGMGIRVSEHPAFGGVHPEQHHPGSAHNDGMAMDINAPGNIVEARDPVWGPKFDKLAKQLQAAGYTVLWRVKDHDNHIHAQIGGKGIRGGASAIGGLMGASPDQAHSEAYNKSTLTPGSTPMTTVQTVPPPSASAERTESGSTAISRPMEPAGSNLPMQIGLGALNSFMPGGLGGIVGSFLPMLTSALGNMNAPMPQAALMPSIGPGQLIGGTSLPEMNSQIVKQTAVQSAANQETFQESLFNETPAQNNIQVNGGQSGYIGDMAGYNYNHPADVSWPDWASLIGGNHWEEAKKIKKHMGA
jgi:hypothetical protein